LAIQLSISPEGWVSLPAVIRARLGVEGGGTLVVEDVENGVLLRSIRQAIQRAQAINRQHCSGGTDASVDAFLAARRNDSGE
jgi:AbrB family looped-hinge helix DNA binding protein